jgi:endonuclease III
LDKNKIKDIISQLKKEFPEQSRKPVVANPLDTLIATMLSQNTTDKTSYRAFKNLKKDFNGWEDVMNAPIEKVQDAIRVCGLANQKSKNIQSLLKQLKEKRGRLSLNYLKKMTDEEIYQDLLQYDGVGLKTISCVLAFSLERDVCAVDTHVHRLSNRLELVNTNTPDKTFMQMKDLIPSGRKFLFHTMLIKYGRKVCRANNPLCGKCVLYDLCGFKDKELHAMKNGSEPKENNFIILEHI